MRGRLLATLAALVAGCAAPVLPGGEVATSEPSPAVAEVLEVSSRAPERPRPPAFALPSFDDSTRTFSLDHFEGQVLLLDFWATWCGPCLQEIPNLTAVHDEFGARGLEILSVSFDLRPEDVAAFRANRFPMAWHHTYVAGGLGAPPVEAFGLTRLPHAVLIGHDGTIVAEGGALRRSLLRTNVEHAILARDAAHADRP